MRKIKFTILLLFAGTAIFGLTSGNDFVPTAGASSGGPPAGYSSAPGESSCSACHGGSTGSGQFAITAPPRYVPGQTYQIEVRHTTADTTRRRWGFQLSPRAANGTTVGAFTNLANTTNNYTSNGRLYIQHTGTGNFGGQTGGATWAFNWTAPATNVGAVTFYAAGNQADGFGTSGDQIYTTSRIVQPALKNTFDFDGDGKSDVAVFRDGIWHLQRSQTGFTAVYWGVASDKIAPADFDGDGKTDTTVYRPSNGEWSVFRSSNGTALIRQFGAPEDLPRPGDFDGDGKADISVWRPSNGTWYRLNSSDGHLVGVQFGAAGDAPLVADFDNDGKSDIAVWRPSNGTWYYLRSSDGHFAAVQFGATTDKPVPADYDGDGKTEIAVWRPANGVWYYLRTTDNHLVAAQFGAIGDLPTAGDYDGDGKADFAVFRPSNGSWYLQRSQSGFTGVQFGLNGDKPIPNAFVP